MYAYVHTSTRIFFKEVKYILYVSKISYQTDKIRKEDISFMGTYVM